jgi:homocysteine S-methyltransferase
VSVAPDPLAPFLSAAGALVLDGGLATELEKAGFDLDHPLWSARVLREAPEAILAVHASYLDAGADCITTASYQATVPGLVREGLTETQARALLVRSVDLAHDARAAFWTDSRRRAGRLRPLVAASVGPYGAFLANGAEYTGDYDLDEAGLAAFHRDRFRLLAASGADLLACETIPSAAEARALATLLAETPSVRAWVSFSCRDGQRLRDGTRFADSVRAVASLPQVVAVGVNCTAPEHVEELLRAAAAVTAKPLVAYPNSGERYEAATKSWRGASTDADWGRLARRWHRAGARLVGGCCRTGPRHVEAIRRELRGAPVRRQHLRGSLSSAGIDRGRRRAR